MKQETCAASLGTLVLLEGILQSWDSAGAMGAALMCLGGVPCPTRSQRSVPQLCRGFSCIWVKFSMRLECSRVLEHASCRCHSWVIQEINWGLGWEAASKWTLCSDLPSAPAWS